MKERKSKEIQEDLRTMHARKREIQAALEAAQKKMLEAQPNGLEYVELDERIQELKKQLPGFTEQKKTLSLELFKALSNEIEEQRALNEKAHAELTPKIRAIIDELETVLASFALKLNKLNAAFAPEGIAPVIVGITANIATQPGDFAAFDNALNLAEAPMSQKLAGLSREWRQLRDELKNL